MSSTGQSVGCDMVVALRQSEPAFAVVEHYYTAAKKEPTGSGSSLTVDKTDTFRSNFLDLVKTLQGKPQAQVVVVAHGGEDGLIMPLTAKTTVSALDAMLQDLAAIVADAPNFNAGKITSFATTASLGEDEVKELATVCQQIKAHGSNCVGVHIRGCKIGKNSGNLDTLRKLFGSTVVTAPSCPMLYASFSPKWQTPALNVEKWKTDNAPKTRRREFTAGSSKLAVDVEYAGSAASTQGAIERLGDLPTWANLVYGHSNHGRQQSMPIAAMWPDSGYFLPHEADYASQIVTSKT